MKQKITKQDLHTLKYGNVRHSLLHNHAIVPTLLRALKGELENNNREVDALLKDLKNILEQTSLKV